MYTFSLILEFTLKLKSPSTKTLALHNKELFFGISYTKQQQLTLWQVQFARWRISSAAKIETAQDSPCCAFFNLASQQNFFLKLQAQYGNQIYLAHQYTN
eukprot:EC095883.1.p3 GENE.EC095883.1~~EC095883.1.p3  ORF type:complete len:100 (-),score=5.53 EC095883.1:121-420(-)